MVFEAAPQQCSAAGKQRRCQCIAHKTIYGFAIELELDWLAAINAGRFVNAFEGGH